MCEWHGKRDHAKMLLYPDLHTSITVVMRSHAIDAPEWPLVTFLPRGRSSGRLRDRVACRGFYAAGRQGCGCEPTQAPRPPIRTSVLRRVYIFNILRIFFYT